MILFPRPRILYLIALALAVPTYGGSLVVFYFAFKRPYDSVGLSTILAAAKRSIEARRVETRYRVNRAAIERTFSKFSDSELTLKYGVGVPFVRWGVLRHPMLNGGEPFTLRVDRRGGTLNVEASPGEAWWLLSDRVWLGRRGTAPGLPASLNFQPDKTRENEEATDPESMALGLLILELAHREEEVELPSLTYDRVSEFVWNNEIGGECLPNCERMRFDICINHRLFYVDAKNMDPEKKDQGGVRITAKLRRESPTPP